MTILDNYRVFKNKNTNCAEGRGALQYIPSNSDPFTVVSLCLKTSLPLYYCSVDTHAKLSISFLLVSSLCADPFTTEATKMPKSKEFLLCPNVGLYHVM